MRRRLPAGLRFRLLLALLAWGRFDTGSTEQFQLAEVHPWIPQFGVSYALGVDGIALALIVVGAATARPAARAGTAEGDRRRTCT